MTDPKLPLHYNGNRLLKREGIKQQWTQEQKSEVKKCIHDPIYFINHYVKIVADDGLVLCNLYKYQREIVNSIFVNRNTIITTSRQAGKTTAVVGAILHYIIFNQYKTVGILANKADTARGILARLKVAFQHLPQWLQVGVTVWNEGSIKFENGCKVIADATSGNASRGSTFQMLFIDEAAHIEGWDEFFTSVYPTISAGKNTKVVLVSTPNGLNYYWNIWKGALDKKNNYNPIFVSWQSVPGRDEKWYKQALEGLNNDIDKFNQEFAAEFMGSSGTLIAGWKLKELYPMKPVAQDGIGLKQYETPIKDHVYWMIADVSRGKGLDYSAFSVIDVTTMPYNQVAVFRSNIMTPFDFSEIIYKTAILYNQAFVLVENKDLGSQVCDILYHDFLYEGVLRTERGGKGYGKRISDGSSNAPTERGIATSTQVKAIGCSVCKLLIEQNQLIINNEETIQEFARFSRKGKSYEAEEGCHDDLVMGIVLFAWATQSQYFKDTTDINTLKQIRDRTEQEHNDIMLPFGFFVTDGNEHAMDFMPITKTWLQDWLNDIDPKADQEMERKVNNMYGKFKFKDGSS